MKDTFKPLREACLSMIGWFLIPVLVTIYLLIRDGSFEHSKGLWCYWVIPIVFISINLTISYCVIEIDEEFVRLKYPFRLNTAYKYPIHVVSSVTWVADSRTKWIKISLKEGFKVEGFWGLKNSARYPHMFGIKQRLAISTTLKKKIAAVQISNK